MNTRHAIPILLLAITPSCFNEDSVAQLVHADQGGFVCTPDQRAHVTIPPGALAEDTTITIEPASTPPQAEGHPVVGPVFDFGPSGTHFATPARVQLAFDPASLQGGGHGLSIFGVSEDGSTGMLTGIWVDWNRHEVYGSTPHFTTFFATQVPSVEFGAASGPPSTPIVAVPGGFPTTVNVTVDTQGRLVINGAEPPSSSTPTPPDAFVIDMYTLGGVPQGSRVLVDGSISDPAPDPSGFSGGPYSYWQRILSIWSALSSAPADASGHIHFVYPSTASSLANELCMAPPGYPSGSVLLTFHLPSGDVPVYLTFARPSFC